jgi:hypothetical protein
MLGSNQPGSNLHSHIRSVMKRDKPNGTTNGIPAVSIFRGIYNRVALKLGVDPSFVSRVARGERSSSSVLAALEEEMYTIREHLNDHLSKSKRNGKLPDAPLQESSPAD